MRVPVLQNGPGFNEHVQWVHFLNCKLTCIGPLLESDAPAFRIRGNSEKPLFIQEGYTNRRAYGNHHWFDYAFKRTLVLKNFTCMQQNFYINSVRGGEVFIEATLVNRNAYNTNPICLQFYGQKVWARNLNPEHTTGWELLADNSDVWILGYKTELKQVEGKEDAFKAVNGARLEILGGLMNAFNDDIESEISYIYNDNASVSFIAREWGVDDESCVFKTFVTEKQGNEVRVLKHTDTPRRGDDQWNQLIPLYVGGK